ncbi:MAG: hypothetical protein MUP52_00425 [Candidatus Aminicenantes bacterium]|nr:hypothetical protein [Candidatus Aminicenantes bacterium]
MRLTSRLFFCYNKKVKGTVRSIFWGCAATLALGLPLASQTIDDFFARLQKSFADKDLASYSSAFTPDIRDRESAAVSSFMHLWKMDRVILYRASRGPDKEGDPGLFLQVLYENDHSAMLEMWHIWLQKTDDKWLIQKKEVTGNVTSLYKVRIPSGRVERADLVEIKHQDIRIAFQDAWVFYDNIPDLETALIVIGKGRFHFSPSSDTEKHQLELRYKRNFVEDTLGYAYFRFSDSFFQNNITIQKAPPDKIPPLTQAESNRAYSLFSEYYPGSFTIENSLTSELLSFEPRGEQVVFELNGKNTGELAYIYSPFSEEEIYFVKRESEQAINLYSPDKQGEGGRELFVSFGEKIDVQRCDLEVDFQPDKRYLSARARIEVKAQIDAAESLKFFFNPSLDILRIFDQEGHELFYTRDKLRKLLYVYFVSPLQKDKTGAIEIYYRGTLEPPVPTSDVIPGGQYTDTISLAGPRYETYLYSESACWYPSPSEEDYFQASLKFSVPPGFICVANGELTEEGKLDSVRRVMALEKVGNSLYEFETKFPIKYLSFIVGKFDRLSNLNGPGSPNLQAFISTEIHVQWKGMLQEAKAIVENYEKWFGSYPYEKLGVVQRLWPTGGGHSPASFVVLNEMPRTPDRPLQVNPDSPVDLSRYREYYIAHEIAHQWWGQAVTGERYHDQWLSEGLAQFAVVQYLKAKLGERTFAGLIKRFSQWTERKSKWGPITLGSRLSYLDFDAYQAIVYNKSAVALNMLLDLLGEEVFFKGLREFFEKYKYRSARTNNFIRSMEQVAGRDLKQFFKGWFDSHLLPEVHVAHDIRKESDGFVLKFRVNQTRDVFVFPLWVEWEENGKKVRQKFEVSAATQEFEFRAASRPAKIKINPDKFVPGNFN